ncbi:major facilitator superfamily domain-containing protein [Emericellopsis atlantica]|uniref:Major facilitator superfamily domain-containing protein n=1 Tax=Emericellopsis atlantica TaxID=2614577 RepID=A0A9P7ZMK0_9HYPO|nr:major facilitator superfamily domain-containing protein [Emericellopsis atlantica]KAG9254477.1 major facilitator superfamily domain-containing protein [Emericellopsis atlantica]
MASQEAGILSPGSSTPLSTSPDNDKSPDLERLGRQRPALLPTWLTEAAFVFTIVASMMMSEYFISGFNIILPAVATALDIPDSARTWPAAVINLTTACLLLPFARLADRHGGRIVFLAGHLWLVIWSLVSGFAQNPVMLIVCRAMQGLGPSAFMPAGLALLARTYRPGPRKNIVFSLYGAFACIGFYVGILLGAVSVEFLTWRWYFWIGTIMSFVVLVSGYFSIPKDLGDDDETVTMDWLGLATIVPGLVLVVFAFADGGHAPQGWKTPYVYVTLILGVLFLAAAVYVQGWVSKNPLLPAELFRPKYMKRLSLALFCAYGVFGLFLFYASFYIETALRVGPLLAAAWFTPLAVGGMVLAITGGFIMHILPNRVLMLISMTGFLLSVLLFAVIPSREDAPGGLTFLYWAYIFPAMLCGTIGVDITFNITNVFITTAMPAKLQSTAGGMINSLLYLGMAFWLGVGELAVSSTVMTQGEANVGLDKQYRIGFYTATGLAGVALLLVATIKMGKAEAGMTADEKADMERELEAVRAREGGDERV